MENNDKVLTDEEYFDNMVQEYSKLPKHENIDGALGMETPDPSADVNTEQEQDINFEDDLEQYIQSFSEDELFENVDIEQPGFVMTAEQADYLIDMYNSIKDEKDEMNKLCDKKIDRVTRAVESYRKARNESFDNSLSYLASKLEIYLKSELAASNKKTKSIKMPGGTIAFRKVQPKVEFEDKNNTTEYLAEKLPGYLNEKTTYSINLKSFKSDIKEVEGKCYIDGIEIPNIKYTAAHDEFQVK